MSYTPRLVVPENGNKYYNRKVNGGYSDCIRGNKKKKCFNSKLDVLPNCVGYVWGRFNEIGNYKEFKYFVRGNAEDLYISAQKIGLKVGKEPKLGAIIVWRKGKTGVSSDGAGHVAIVEQINSDTQIVTSESGWDSNVLFWTQTRNKGTNGNWGQSTSYTLVGFIYNPAVDDETFLKKGDKGTEVKNLQISLNMFGWYDLATDSSFGSETEKAVKDAQVKLGLTVSGYADKKFLNELSIANKLPTNTKFKSFIVDGKNRSLPCIVIDDWNFIRLKDLDFKFNYASVNYDYSKKISEVKSK